MAIRTILGFTRTVSELRPKLSQIENTLNRVREGMKENKELVDNLSTEVTPIRDLEGKMRGHYEDMQELQLNEEKKKLAEEEAETGRKRRIQRKKMGFGESETEELA